MSLKVSFTPISIPFRGFRILVANIGGERVITDGVGIRDTSGKPLWADYREGNEGQQGRVVVVMKKGDKKYFYINLDDVCIDRTGQRAAFQNDIDPNSVVAFVYDQDNNYWCSPPPFLNKLWKLGG